MTVTLEKDVVVIGGGPAGSSAAVTLARAGLRVAVLERSAFTDRRVGELVAPEVAAALQAMDAWKRFRQDGHLPVSGIVTSWGEARAQVNNFLRTPFGVAWVVDRRRFDRLLLETAAQAGADTLAGATARRSWHEGDGWTIDATQNDRVLRLRARYIVDATGRARGPRAGARSSTDRLTACICYLELPRGAADDPTLPVVESAAGGWWFSARLPDGSLAIALFTDADLLPSNRSLMARTFWHLLAQAPLTRQQLPGTPVRHTFHRCAADSQWRPATEPHRIAAGDCLMSMDPLSGRGVLAALESGRLAADAVVACEAEGDAAIAHWNAAQQRRFESYLIERDQQYRAEQRWSSAPFWRRRLGRPDALRQVVG